MSQLLAEFFAVASQLLRPHGQCHLRLTDKFATARGLRNAQNHGFVVESRIDFFPAFENIYDPLGYRPTRGSRRFSVQHSSTFVLKRTADIGMHP
eukprot:3037696-Amphidinium_carterae.1